MADLEQRQVVSAGTPLAVEVRRPVRTPAPAVVLAHGFGMTRGCRLDEVAAAFTAAGYATFLFDHPNFGGSGGRHRQVVDVPAQRQAYADVVAAARRDPDVDGRVVAWGTSFSGGHVLWLAARDPDLAAAIAQVPFADGRALLSRGERGGASADPDARRAFVRHLAVLVRRALVDRLRGVLGLRPLLVPVAGPVGSGAVIAGDGAEEAVAAMVPPHVPWRNEVAPRVVLALPRLRPGRDAGAVAAPLLVCTVEHDPVTPPGPARRAAAAAPRGELATFGFDHFAAYVPPGRDALLAAQLTFLARHVPVASAPSS